MAATPSPTIVNTTVDELRLHAPFAQMDVSRLRRMASQLQLRYFAKGATILAPADGVVNVVLIVQRGVVSGEDGTAEVGALTLTEGEIFPLGAVISTRATLLTYRAATDVFCYEMSKDVFQGAMDASPPFRNFAMRRLAHLLDQSMHHTQTLFSAALSREQSLASPLKSVLRRAPVVVDPSMPVGEVLRLMQQERIGSVVVVDPMRVPVGIFTERDVLERVALPRADPMLPVSAVMTAQPFTLPSHASVLDAARVMVERRFRHVPVTEDGRLVGVVSERDLFALQRLSPGEVAKTIDQAGDVAALQAASVDVRRMALAFVAHGVAAEQLTQFVTTMNDALVGRALVLARRQCAPPDVAWCWMGLGSEGRMEQTLATDQDNAIVFAADEHADADAIKTGLLAFAAAANQILDAVGFPLCRGDIMAKNPQWCLSEAEWRDTFGHWLRAANPQALLNAAIFFDLRALHGETSLVDNLKTWLAGAVITQPIFLRQMAVNALQVTPPIGVLRDFVDADAEHPGSIDLKIYAARPFIDAARIFALTHQVGATNTAERLRQAAAKLRMGDDEVNAYVDAFHFVQMLRLRHQHAPAGNPNRLQLDSLNELDRRILKEALRQARKLQSRLEMDYRL